MKPYPSITTARNPRFTYLDLLTYPPIQYTANRSREQYYKTLPWIPYTYNKYILTGPIPLGLPSRRHCYYTLEALLGLWM